MYQSLQSQYLISYSLFPVPSGMVCLRTLIFIFCCGYHSDSLHQFLDYIISNVPTAILCAFTYSTITSLAGHHSDFSNPLHFNLWSIGKYISFHLILNCHKIATFRTRNVLPYLFFAFQLFSTILFPNYLLLGSLHCLSFLSLSVLSLLLFTLLDHFPSPRPYLSTMLSKHESELSCKPHVHLLVHVPVLLWPSGKAQIYVTALSFFLLHHRLSFCSDLFSRWSRSKIDFLTFRLGGCEISSFPFLYSYWTSFYQHMQGSHISIIHTWFSSGFWVHIYTPSPPHRYRLCQPILDRFVLTKHCSLLQISSLSLLDFPLKYLQSFFVSKVLLSQKRKHITWPWLDSHRHWFMSTTCLFA